MDTTSKTSPGIPGRIGAAMLAALLTASLCLPVAAGAAAINSTMLDLGSDDADASETYADVSDLAFNYSLDVAHAKITAKDGTVLKEPDIDADGVSRTEDWDYDDWADYYISLSSKGAGSLTVKEAQLSYGGETIYVGFGALLYYGSQGQGEAPGHSRPTVYARAADGTMPEGVELTDCVTITFERAARVKGSGAEIDVEVSFSPTLGDCYDRYTYTGTTTGYIRVMEWHRWDDKGNMRLVANSEVYDGLHGKDAVIGSNTESHDDFDLRGYDQIKYLNTFRPSEVEADHEAHPTSSTKYAFFKQAQNVSVSAYLNGAAAKTSLTGTNSGTGKGTVSLPIMFEGLDVWGHSADGSETYNPALSSYIEGVELYDGWATDAYGLKNVGKTSYNAVSTRYDYNGWPCDGSDLDSAAVSAGVLHYLSPRGNSIFSATDFDGFSSASSDSSLNMRFGVMPVIAASGSSALKGTFTWKGDHCGSMLSVSPRTYLPNVKVKKVDEEKDPLFDASHTGFALFKKADYEKYGTSASKVGDADFYTIYDGLTDNMFRAQDFEWGCEYVIVELYPPTGYTRANPQYFTLEWEDYAGKEVVFTFVDKKIPTITVDYSHSFVDMNDHLQLRPDTVSVALLRDGTEVDRISVGSDSGFSGTFSAEGSSGKDGKFYYEDEDGKAYTWTISQTVVTEGINAEYTTTFSPATSEGSVEAGTYTVHFSGASELARTTTLGVTKTWTGDASIDGVRPSTVTARVLRQVVDRDTGAVKEAWKETGTSVTLSEGSGWKAQVAGLAIGYGTDTYLYKVAEDVPDGYKASYSGEMVADATSTELVINNKLIKVALPKTGGIGLPWVLGIGAVTAAAGAALWAWSARRRRAGEEIAEAFARRRPAAR